VPDAREIAVVDLDTGGQTASWQIPDLRANFPMAFDAARAAIAVVFRSPARLVIVDVKTGIPSSTLMTCGDADDVFFDAKRRRVYVSCGDGNADVWQQDGDHFRRLNLFKTASGAPRYSCLIWTSCSSQRVRDSSDRARTLPFSCCDQLIEPLAALPQAPPGQTV
jgi:hypothetical protein